MDANDGKIDDNDPKRASGPADLPETESPSLAPSQSADHKVTTAVALFKGANPDPPPEAAKEASWAGRLMTRVPPIAAAIAVCVAIGAGVGMFGAFGGGETGEPASQQLASLNATITRLSTEVAALKAAQESRTKTTAGQLTRIGERVERAERAQAEPSARLSKLSETVDRLDKRIAALATPAPVPATAREASSADVTGTIPSQGTSSVNKDLSRLPVIPGWTLQRVEGGTAYISSREGMIEVAVGNALPGGGRVEAIRRQDGRWVVVTNRGLVVTR
jgi:hypothetical protein